MQFTYNLPVNLQFGRGIVEEAGKKTGLYGKKALIVTGTSSTKKTGLLGRVQALLEKAGLSWALFDKVTPNPTTATVYEGVTLLKTERCDVVLGLGGGSIMDAAKAIAFMARNDGDLMDYIYGRKAPGEALPIVLIPTTSGTGSEGNSFAVITDSATGDKKSLRCNQIIAKLSLIDPDLMTTMPRGVLASVGFDALCHCFEAYISKITQPLAASMALDGVALIHESLLPLYEGRGGPDEWEKLTWASTLGGMSIGLAGVTAPHGLEHPPSGLRDIVHGKGLAALSGAIYRRTIAAAPPPAQERFSELARRMGGKGAADFVPLTEALIDALGLRSGLRAQGVRDDDIDWLAENALKVSAAGIANHPVQFSLEEIKAIYKEAM
ncbi:MAG: iron-containing alcohol dehydrogenase [Treponema sp.]|jgi:alcohol dehydrogenase class IV|nr:iron-containing alcohol dehydrogenase [Treponema sp.]